MPPNKHNHYERNDRQKALAEVARLEGTRQPKG